jgi:hypothetical protein
MYVIVAVFDEDGGYGDAIETTNPVAVFTNKSEAATYIVNYSNKHVYERPYDELHEGELRVVEVPLNPDKEVTEW